MKAEEIIKTYFNEEGKLKQYPAKKTIRETVLLEIAKQFDPDRKYTEKEVNEVIKSSILFSDHELIRREMFMYQILGRLRDGSQYWLEKKSTEETVEK